MVVKKDSIRYETVNGRKYFSFNKETKDVTIEDRLMLLSVAKSNGAQVKDLKGQVIPSFQRSEKYPDNFYVENNDDIIYLHQSNVGGIKKCIEKAISKDTGYGTWYNDSEQVAVEANENGVKVWSKNASGEWKQTAISYDGAKYLLGIVETKLLGN